MMSKEAREAERRLMQRAEAEWAEEDAKGAALRVEVERLREGLEQVWRIAARAQRGGAGSAIVEIEPLVRALLEPEGGPEGSG